MDEKERKSKVRSDKYTIYNSVLAMFLTFLLTLIISLSARAIQNNAYLQQHLVFEEAKKEYELERIETAWKRRKKVWARDDTVKYFDNFVETIDKYASTGARDAAYASWPEEVKFNLFEDYKIVGEKFSSWYTDKYGIQVIGCNEEDCRRPVRYI